MESFEMCVAWELATESQFKKLKSLNDKNYRSICFDISEMWEIYGSYEEALTEVLGD